MAINTEEFKFHSDVVEVQPYVSVLFQLINPPLVNKPPLVLVGFGSNPGVWLINPPVFTCVFKWVPVEIGVLELQSVF